MIDLWWIILTHFAVYIIYISAITLHTHQRIVSGTEYLRELIWLHSQPLKMEVSNAYGESIAICWARYSSRSWGTSANLIFLRRKYIQLSVWWASVKSIFLYLFHFLCSDTTLFNISYLTNLYSEHSGKHHLKSFGAILLEKERFYKKMENSASFEKTL